jgi:hypothetical protein
LSLGSHPLATTVRISRTTLVEIPLSGMRLDIDAGVFRRTFNNEIDSRAQLETPRFQCSKRLWTMRLGKVSQTHQPHPISPPRSNHLMWKQPYSPTLLSCLHHLTVNFPPSATLQLIHSKNILVLRVSFSQMPPPRSTSVAKTAS